MAISWWPKHDEQNTEAAFAAYVDKLTCKADHAAGDTDFQLKFTGTAGGLDTYTLTAGAYIFDGFVFTAAGTETISVTTATQKAIYLCYTVDSSSHIASAGIYETATKPSAPSGGSRQDKLLWLINVGGVIGKVLDYRQIFTWGRTSYANADADCVDFLSTPVASKVGGTTYDSAKVIKSFRVAYPGEVRLDFDACCSGTTYNMDIYIYRGATATKDSSQAISSVYPTYQTKSNIVIDGLMPGDEIQLHGGANSLTFYARNFRIRYKTTDTPSPAILLD